MCVRQRENRTPTGKERARCQKMTHEDLLGGVYNTRSSCLGPFNCCFDSARKTITNFLASDARKRDKKAFYSQSSILIDHPSRWYGSIHLLFRRAFCRQDARTGNEGDYILPAYSVASPA